MRRKFEAGMLNIPEDVPEQNWSMPLILIGVEAFSLKCYLMRPYPYRQAREDEVKRAYIYRMSC
jgi:hypothetical protein